MKMEKRGLDIGFSQMLSRLLIVSLVIISVSLSPAAYGFQSGAYTALEVFPASSYPRGYWGGITPVAGSFPSQLSSGTGVSQDSQSVSGVSDNASETQPAVKKSLDSGFIPKQGLMRKVYDSLSIASPVSAQVSGCCYNALYWCQTVPQDVCCTDCLPGEFTPSSCDVTDCENSYGCCVQDCADMSKKSCGFSGDFRESVYCADVPECETGVCADSSGQTVQCREGVRRKDCPNTNDMHFYPGMSSSEVSECQGAPAETGSITGVVRYNSGGVAIGAKVEVSSSPVLYDNTDQYGSFLIQNVYTGTYSVTASISPYTPVTNSSVEVFKDQTTNVVLVIDSGSSVTTGDVSGYVYNATYGKPLQNAYIYWSDGSSTLSTFSLADGSYFLRNVPEGSRNITASYTGFEPSSVTAEVDAGAESANNNFILNPSDESPLCGNGKLDSGEDCDGSIDSACPGYCSGCKCPTSCSEIYGQGHECDFTVQCTSNYGSYINYSGLVIAQGSSPPFDNNPSDGIIGIPSSDATRGCCDQPCNSIPSCLPDEQIADSYQSTGTYCKCEGYYFNTIGNSYYCCQGPDGSSEFSVYPCQNVVGVSGYVKNLANGAPVDAASVRFSYSGSTKGSVVTGQDGFYSFELSAGKNYTVEVTASSGYYSNTTYFYVQPGLSSYSFNITMEPVDTCQLNPIPHPSLSLSGSTGTSDITATWGQECSHLVTSFVLYRKKSTEPGFVPIRTLNPPFSFPLSYTDSSTDWETGYTYRVVVNSIKGQNATDAYIETGSSVCEGKAPSQEFCVDSGYNFTNALIYRVVCDQNNNLRFIHSGQIGHSYGNCTLYGIDNLGEPAYCRYLSSTSTECGLGDRCEELGLGSPYGVLGKNILGLYYYQSYENSTTALNCTHKWTPSSSDYQQRFCYYDYTYTSVDSCKSCLSTGSCFDYLSKEACEADTCRYGQRTNTKCMYYESDDYFRELGKGICYPEGYKETDKCSVYCGPNAKGLFRNLGCTDQLCESVGKCFSSSGSCASCTASTKCETYASERACEGASGTGFSVPAFGSQQCSSSTSLVFSDDSCGLQRCSWDGSKCFKDGDGNGVEDCLQSLSPDVCRGDLSSPLTALSSVPAFINASGSFVNFSVQDLPLDTENTTTFFCISGSECCPTDSVVTNGTFSILFSNQTSGLEGVEAYMKLYYYSKDRNMNIEPIKNAEILVDTVPPSLQINGYTRYNYTGSSDRSYVGIDITVSDSRNYTYCTMSLAGGPENVNLVNTRYVTLDSQSFTETFTNQHGSTPGLADGNYMITVTCKDTTENYASVSDTVFIDRINKIIAISPNTTTTESDLKVSLWATDNYYACRLVYGAAEYRMSKVNTVSPYQYVTNDKIHFTASQTYSLPVYCYMSESDYNSNNPAAASNALFTIDMVPPVTTWKVYHKDYNYYSAFDSGMNYAPVLFLKAFCKDPDINVSGQDVQYPPLGEFGCNSTSFCTTSFLCSVEDCSEGPFTQGNSANFSASGCLCYKSLDKSLNIPGNEEDVVCTDVRVSSQNPSVTIASPNKGFATTLDYQQVDFAWNNAAGDSTIYLIWRSEDLLNYRSSSIIVSNSSGSSSLSMNLLFPGKNYIELFIYDETYTGGELGKGKATSEIYYDRIGPNITLAQVLNEKNERIDHDESSYGVAGFNTNITFVADVNDYMYVDRNGVSADDISVVSLEIRQPADYGTKGPYNMTHVSGPKYRFVYDPSLYGFLFSGEHNVIYHAADTAYNPQGDYNENNLSQAFTINESTVFTSSIYNSVGQRIDTGSASAEYGTPITFNGAISNPQYIEYADISVSCISSCEKEYSRSFRMDRNSSSDPFFAYVLEPDELLQGSFDLGAGAYEAAFMLYNRDGKVEVFKSNFRVADSFGPTFDIELVTAEHNSEGLPVITSSKEGSLRYYDVLVTPSEPVDIDELDFEVFLPSSKSISLFTFGQPVKDSSGRWKFRIAVPLSDPFYNGLYGNNSRFSVKAYDMSGNQANQADIVSGMYFETDTFGGNAPVLEPEIPNLSVFTGSELLVSGYTSPREGNVLLELFLSGVKSTAYSGANGDFSVKKNFLNYGGNILNITPIDYLDNVGLSALRSLIWDITPFSVISTSPSDGEVLAEVLSLKATLFDGESGINTSSLSLTVDSQHVQDFNNDWYKESYVELVYSSSFPEGQHTYQISGNNNAGLFTSKSVSFKVDSSVPLKPYINISGANYVGYPHYQWYTKETEGLRFTVQFVPGNGNFEIIDASIIELPGAGLECIGSTGALFTCTSYEHLSEGTYTIQLEARGQKEDGSWGNAGTYIFDFEVDTTPPAFSPESPSLFTNDKKLVLSGTYSGLEEDDRIIISGDLESAVSAELDNLMKTYSATVMLEAPVEGTYNVTINASDKAGNYIVSHIEVVYDLHCTMPQISRVYSTYLGYTLLELEQGNYITNIGQEEKGISVDGTAEKGRIEVWRSHEGDTGMTPEILEGYADVDSGNFTILLTLGQSDGYNYIRLLSEDMAGNRCETNLTIFSDTSGADVSQIAVEQGLLPSVGIGSTNQSTGIEASTPSDCGSYLPGSISWDACQINRMFSGDANACLLIANPYLKRSCCSLTEVC